MLNYNLDINVVRILIGLSMLLITSILDVKKREINQLSVSYMNQLLYVIFNYTQIAKTV